MPICLRFLPKEIQADVHLMKINSALSTAHTRIDKIRDDAVRQN